MLRSRGDPLRFFLRTRSLLDNTKNNDSDLFKGSITVDFYRTYEDKEFLGIPWRDFSISNGRIHRQIEYLNCFYDKRITFSLGDVYTLEDDSYTTPRTCFEIRNSFLDDVKDSFRVSVLVVKEFSDSQFGCAFVDSPLGGNFDSFGNRQLPAIVLTANNPVVPVFTAGLGAPLIGGFLIAHEMGHILGFWHTAANSEFEPFVYSYTSCGIDREVRYPVFSNRIPEGIENKFVWDDVTGARYDYEDWQGRTNVMAQVTAFNVLQPWKATIFRDDYSSRFDDILECWFEQSKRSAAIGDGSQRGWIKKLFS